MRADPTQRIAELTAWAERTERFNDAFDRAATGELSGACALAEAAQELFAIQRLSNSTDGTTLTELSNDDWDLGEGHIGTALRTAEAIAGAIAQRAAIGVAVEMGERYKRERDELKAALDTPGARLTPEERERVEECLSAAGATDYLGGWKLTVQWLCTKLLGDAAEQT